MSDDIAILHHERDATAARDLEAWLHALGYDARLIRDTLHTDGFVCFVASRASTEDEGLAADLHRLARERRLAWLQLERCQLSEPFRAVTAMLTPFELDLPSRHLRDALERAGIGFTGDKDAVFPFAIARRSWMKRALGGVAAAGCLVIGGWGMGVAARRARSYASSRAVLVGVVEQAERYCNGVERLVAYVDELFTAESFPSEEVFRRRVGALKPFIDEVNEAFLPFEDKRNTLRSDLLAENPSAGIWDAHEELICSIRALQWGRVRLLINNKIFVALFRIFYAKTNPVPPNDAPDPRFVDLRERWRTVKDLTSARTDALRGQIADMLLL